jgi:uncharacterized membrane protein YcjF (UPF0283 family)
MSKNIKKVRNIDMENIEREDGVLEENEMTEVSKPKLSLKKKLLIGGGVLAGLVLGAVALGSRKSVEPAEDLVEDSDDDDEVADTDVTGSEEIPEKIEE